jgi:hypothetical protein
MERHSEMTKIVKMFTGIKLDFIVRRLPIVHPRQRTFRGNTVHILGVFYCIIKQSLTVQQQLPFNVVRR